jgi:hypothetical protein
VIDHPKKKYLKKVRNGKTEIPNKKKFKMEKKGDLSGEKKA